jgi:hypothetical protein
VECMVVLLVRYGFVSWKVVKRSNNEGDFTMCLIINND